MGVFSCQYHSTMVLHARISWGWTMGPFMAAVQRCSLRIVSRLKSNVYLLACVLRLTMSVLAGGLSPMEFSAHTRKNNLDLSFRFSMQCWVTDDSNVTTFVHVFSEASLISMI
jgi:hypothetical protein